MKHCFSPDLGVSPPRIRLGETGYPGLKVIQKQILEEANRKLRMPHLIREIDEMKKDASISAALDFYRMMTQLSGEFNHQSEQHKKNQKELSSLSHVLTTWIKVGSLSSNQFFPCVDYGFCVAEKVFKRRTKYVSNF